MSSMPAQYDDTSTNRPNPERRRLAARRVAKAPWWLLLIVIFVLAFVANAWGDQTYANIWRGVSEGIGITLWVTVVAFSASMLLGLLIAIMRRSNNFFIYQISTLYVEFVRGIPTLVLVYYVVLALTPQAISLINALGDYLVANGLTFATGLAELRTRDVPTTTRAIIGLAISYSAFLSEVFRAGIDSIPNGQREAALSVGMTRWQVARYVILPQAFRVMLPPLGNDFIAMLKESSLVSIVGVEDITRRGNTYAQSTFTFFQTYNVVALTYLVLTLTLSSIVRGVEAYLDRGQNAERE